MPLRKMIEYVPLGLHAYLWMGIGFVFWYFVGVLLGGGGFGTVVFAMIAGPFSGWVAGTIYWMLRLIPVEREIARQAEVKRQRRQRTFRTPW